MKTIYCFVNRYSNFVEDFIDENTGEVVSIPIKNIKKPVYITRLKHMPDGRTRKDDIDIVNLYFKSIGKNLVTSRIITAELFRAICNKEVKKYRNITVLAL